MKTKMSGAILPGNSTVELKSFDIPKPGHGEILVTMKSSTICGSDIRCIYRQHLGKGPEGYQPGMIAGHEPCGQIVESGPGCRRFKTGDRVIVYHISGCGLCDDCRRGYMISCTSEKYRRAYGWQRDGGMAEYLLAEEKDLVFLHVEAPDEASHEGSLEKKLKAIEDFDREVVGRVLEGLSQVGPFSLLVLTDHFTPLEVMTHTREPAPLGLLRSEDAKNPKKNRGYSERSALEGEVAFPKGDDLMPWFIQRGLRPKV